MSIRIVKDNSDEIIKEMLQKKAKVLEKWGLIAERYAKEECPVNTGRLHDSITYATNIKHSTGGPQAEPDDYKTKATPDESECHVGTNVEYAEVVETSDTARHKVGRSHFLRDSVAKHESEYFEEMDKEFKGFL